MSSKPAKVVTDQQILDALSGCGGNKTSAAKALGIPRTTLNDRLSTIDYKPSMSMDQRGDKITLDVDDPELTPDEALKRAKIDTAIWEIERTIWKWWDTSMKLVIDGQEKPHKQRNYGFTVYLRRKIPRVAEEAYRLLLERMKKYSPKYHKPNYKKVTDPHLLEVAVFDHHFGKYAWAPEAGNDYDLNIAEKIFETAIMELLQKVHGYNIERILFPVGNDIIHINSQANTTEKGTPQDVDGRLPKIVMTASMACVRMIDKMREVAPVDIILVPDNHGPTQSLGLCHFLWAWYRHDKSVSVDTSPKSRKYYDYGTVLLGFTHGDKEKHQDLGLLMMNEAPKLLDRCRVREWHVGHYHKPKEMKFTPLDTHGGLTVRIIPTLSGTDKWHYDKGYVGARRAAEAYLWSKENGYTGHFSANVS